MKLTPAAAVRAIFYLEREKLRLQSIRETQPKYEQIMKRINNEIEALRKDLNNDEKH